MYTVSDFQKTYRNSLSLVAGPGGVSHPITSAGFLDYELVPELKNKYYHSNIVKDQLLITSFLYAKDNEFEIIDAVKHLVSKGCAGLVIRNVFNLTIPDMVIRYANSKNFPIFLLESNDIFFEDIVYVIRKQQAQTELFKEEKNTIDRILNTSLSPKQIREQSFKLNPSFNDQFFCIYCHCRDSFLSEDPLTYFRKIRDTNFDTAQTLTLISDNEIYHIRSGDKVAEIKLDQYAKEFTNIILARDDRVTLGISLLHNTLNEFKLGLEESRYSSQYCEIMGLNKAEYNDLKTYKVVFPFAQSDAMGRFSNFLLEPIKEFDTYYNYDFYETLKTYVNTGNSIARTAEISGMHEQSVRYRLNKIYSLIDLDPKDSASLEQLALAVKIQNVRELFENKNLM